MKIILNFFKTLINYLMIKMVFGVTVEEKGTKCALPSCNIYTTHRGGYCCAEHKLMHKEMHKGGR